MNKFHVLLYDQNKVKHYDVLPYFRKEWKKKYNKKERTQIKALPNGAARKKLFKEWIRSQASYQYRARCQYEFLMASWPFGSYRINQDLKKFLTPEFNIDDYSQNIDFYNILMQDMEKIDIYDQIMMNIDVITDILYNEFFD